MKLFNLEIIFIVEVIAGINWFIKEMNSQIIVVGFKVGKFIVEYTHTPRN